MGSIDHGVAIVTALARYDPSVADVVDTLEEALDDPDDIREVFRRAEAEGVIERDGKRITLGEIRQEIPKPGAIVTVEGEFSCRRCNRAITTGYLLRVGETEVGPYGSTCIRKITGRE